MGVDQRQAADLTAAMEALFTGTHSAAVTVSPTPAHYAPHKTLTVGSEGRVEAKVASFA